MNIIALTYTQATQKAKGLAKHICVTVSIVVGGSMLIPINLNPS